jgi:hypothetical protein
VCEEGTSVCEEGDESDEFERASELSEGCEDAELGSGFDDSDDDSDG